MKMILAFIPPHRLDRDLGPPPAPDTERTHRRALMKSGSASPSRPMAQYLGPVDRFFRLIQMRKNVRVTKMAALPDDQP